MSKHLALVPINTLSMQKMENGILISESKVHIANGFVKTCGECNN